MRKLLSILLGLAVLVTVACAGSAPPTLTSVPSEEPAVEPEPATVDDGSGTPQLVEFYADW